MYKIEIQGCLSSIFILALVIFIIAKLWWLIVGLVIIAIVYYYSRLVYLTITEQKNQAETNYEPKDGEVFKVCPYCNTKVRVSAISCPRIKIMLTAKFCI